MVTKMANTRRHFLKLMSSGLLLTPLQIWAKSHGSFNNNNDKNSINKRLISCYDNTHGEHFIAILDPLSGQNLSIPITQRGHGTCLSPDNRTAIIFARRPGTLIWVVDLQHPKIVTTLSSPEHCHFYGHGIFEPQGRYLYVPENDFNSGQGYIAVYDSHLAYRRVSEFSSQGIGPHEIKFLRDGKTLVVANGGIQTHPDLGRSKLNLSDMRPNLAYLDTEHSGQLLSKYEPPKHWHQLSMRHLSIAPDNTVAIALQFQGPKNQYPPLLITHKGEDSLKLHSAPEKIQKQMKNYCGSICHDSSGEFIALSSPRGNLTTFWSQQGNYLNHIQVNDGCGLASGTGKGEIFVSGGKGSLYQHQILTSDTHQITLGETIHARWDNHMIGAVSSH